MKRARATPPLFPSTKSPPPLHATLQPKTPPIPSRKLKSINKNPNSPKWLPLNLAQSELSLPLTFPTGQTFRWRQTGPLQFTGPIGPHLVSLKHLHNGDVSYCIHRTPSESAARDALLDFLNVNISLVELWAVFSAKDPHFAELARHLRGARVLRQDPLECLVQFLCSSNNNIGRITKMVDFIGSLGTHLGSVGEFEFYEFPSLERLSMVSEIELREAGFGYRAKYIAGTINTLWSDLQEAIDALCTLSGVTQGCSLHSSLLARSASCDSSGYACLADCNQIPPAGAYRCSFDPQALQPRSEGICEQIREICWVGANSTFHCGATLTKGPPTTSFFGCQGEKTFQEKNRRG